MSIILVSHHPYLALTLRSSPNSQTRSLRGKSQPRGKDEHLDRYSSGSLSALSLLVCKTAPHIRSTLHSRPHRRRSPILQLTRHLRCLCAPRSPWALLVISAFHGVDMPARPLLLCLSPLLSIPYTITQSGGTLRRLVVVRLRVAVMGRC